MLTLASVTAHAQFSGSVGLELESASNVERLDTTSPDVIAMPSITLSYQFNPSAVTAIPVTGAWLPGYYTQNTALTYSALSLAATPSFYLTNTASIAREAEGSAVSAATPKDTVRANQSKPAKMVQRSTQPKSTLTNDQLTDLAVSDLYDLSVGLDSTELNSKSLSKAQVASLEGLRDSISEAAVTVADLLDSMGYSEPVVLVLEPELVSLLDPMDRLKGKTQPSLAPLLEHLTNAIAELSATKSQADQTAVGDQSEESDQTENPVISSYSLAVGPVEPAITLVSPGVRVRDFTSSDLAVAEDLADSSAKTLATLLQVPLSYYKHTGKIDSAYSPQGNPNDSRVVGVGASIDLYASAKTAYRFSYAFTKSTYPFDDVYSNTENRIQLGARFGLGESTVMFGTAGLGFRNYTNTPVNILPSKKKAQFAGDFSQFSLGLGLASTASERFTIGGAAAIARNLNLRAYITNPGSRKLRQAAQIADDEYTYDMIRGALFAATRLPGEIDAGFDLSYEHRLYGTVAARQAQQQYIEGAGRTDNGLDAGLSLTKLILFDDRALGVFDGLSLSAGATYTDVSSTDELYTYSNVDLVAGFSLSF